MAKANATHVKVKGKLGDKVYVSTKRHGYHMRNAPPPGSKKNEPAFKKQYSRALFLNQVAGEINKVLTIYAYNFKSNDFYQQCLLKRFRKEPLDNRFLMLQQLKGIDINPLYPFYKLGSCTTAVKGLKNNIQVTLRTREHPPRGKYMANCYYYEVSLLSWMKGDQPVTHSRQASNWIKIVGGHDEFEFLFPKPAGTTHWLLCLRQILGVDGKRVEARKGESMQVTDVGSFDKKEIALLEKVGKERKASPSKKMEEEVVRVMAKRHYAES